MNDKAQQPNEAPPQEAEGDHGQHDELHGIQEFVRTRGPAIIVGVLAAVVIVAAIGLYRRHRENRLQEAQAELAQAQSVGELKTWVERFEGTPPMPAALLKLATAEYRNGEYEAALRHYRELQTEYRDHPLGVAAALGVGHALEAIGQPEAALEAFSAFATTLTNHFLRTEAVLGKGRALLQLGRLDDARVVYESFLAQSPDHAMAPRAEEWLKRIERAKEGRGIPFEAPAIPAALPAGADEAWTMPTPTLPAGEALSITGTTETVPIPPIETEPTSPPPDTGEVINVPTASTTNAIE